AQVLPSQPRGAHWRAEAGASQSSSPEHPMPVPATPGEIRERLEALFRAHHALIWRTLRRLGASPEGAADFTQQAFVIAAERFAQIRPGCEKAYLFSTAIGLSHTSRRRELRCQLEQDMEVHAHRVQEDENLTRQHYARQLL